MIGIDTNILVRYLVQDDVAQAAIATRFLATECTSEKPGWVNRIVLCELVWVLERVYRVPREEIAGMLEALAQTAEFQLEDIASVWTALRLYRGGKADFPDALLAVTNRVHGCERTVTFDKRAGHLDGMQLIEQDA